VKNEIRLAEMWISQYFNRKPYILNNKAAISNCLKNERMTVRYCIVAIFFITVKHEALVS
jgi:hypothetical protein